MKKTSRQRILSERERTNSKIRGYNVGLSSHPDNKSPRRTNDRLGSRDLPGKEVGGELGSTAYRAFRDAGGNNFLNPDPKTRKQYDTAVKAAGDAVRKLQARRKARAENPELDAALRKLESKHPSPFTRNNKKK